MGTRASKEQYEAVKEVIPDVIYDPLGRTLKLQFDQPAPVGEIAVCTAGTSDISVAEKSLPLLAENQLSITEISAKTGFSSPGYFSRIFREQMHCSPTQYRVSKK